jgi:hypothetical protein
MKNIKVITKECGGERRSADRDEGPWMFSPLRTTVDEVKQL